MDFKWKDAKLESLLGEAEQVGLVHSYSCCALLRMIVERALDLHIRKSKNLPSLKGAYAALKVKEGVTLTPQQIDDFEPSLRYMVDWLKGRKNYFPVEARSECSEALGKFGKALTSTLNGAMHKAKIVSDAEIKQIRNDVYPLLKFLLENEPSKLPQVP